MNCTGPLLGDESFFCELIDLSGPEMGCLNAVIAKKDFKTARGLFAKHVRASLKPEKYLPLVHGYTPENPVMQPGEDPEEAAERILSLKLISCGTPYQFVGQVDWFANPTYNQYKEWTWQLSRHHEFGLLARAYHVNRNERFARCFIKLFTSWVRQAVVPEDAEGYDTLCWRTIEAGIRMSQSWPLALHVFYDSPAFDDEVLVDWYKSVWEHGWRLRNFHRKGNWLVMEMNGLAHIGLLYPQFKASEEWLKYSLTKLVKELDSQVYPDGFQFELTTNYHQVVIKNYEKLWKLCDAYDAKVPAEFSKILEKMHEVNIRIMMPDGRLPDINDGAWVKAGPLFTNAVGIYPDRTDFLWAWSEGREGMPPKETSWAFNYAGLYVSRSGWDKEALWALFDAGPFGEAHQHEDKLNLLLFAYGRLLLTEGGNYAYDTSEMRKYVLSTRAHNTVLVDGLGQNRRSGYKWQDEDIQRAAGACWFSKDGFDASEGLYDEGYGPDNDKTVTHKRSVIFFKEETEGIGSFVVCIDRLIFEDEQEHRFDLLWHINSEKARVEGACALSEDEGEPNITIMVSEREGLSLKIVKGQQEPEWQGWKAYKNLQGAYEPVATAVYTYFARTSVRIVTLLYPTGKDDRCTVTGVTAGSDINSTEFILNLKDGAVLQFDETSYFQ